MYFHIFIPIMNIIFGPADFKPPLNICRSFLSQDEFVTLNYLHLHFKICIDNIFTWVLFYSIH